MIALGYIERPDENKDKAIKDAVCELRYNLAESYQDDSRHFEAADILRELYSEDPDEQRYAVRYFVSCQALGNTGEMKRIVEDLDGRRRTLYEEAARKLAEFRTIAEARRNARKAGEREDAGDPDAAEPGENPDPEKKAEPLLSDEERKERAKWRNLRRYGPAVVDYLKGQLLTAEKRYSEALECLERVTEAHLARPGLLIQTGDLYRKLKRFREARLTYEKAVAIDPITRTRTWVCAVWTCGANDGIARWGMRSTASSGVTTIHSDIFCWGRRSKEWENMSGRPKPLALRSR